MTATWPINMPTEPRSGGYSETRQPALARYQPAIGVDITRPRTTAVILMVDASFPPVTRTVGQEFLDWFDTTLKQGSLPFLWTNPRTAIESQWKFMEPPTVSDVGGLKDGISIRIMRLPGTEV